jgi:hypothetical protein
MHVQSIGLSIDRTMHIDKDEPTLVQWRSIAIQCPIIAYHQRKTAVQAEGMDSDGNRGMSRGRARTGQGPATAHTMRNHCRSLALHRSTSPRDDAGTTKVEPQAAQASFKAWELPRSDTAPATAAPRSSNARRQRRWPWTAEHPPRWQPPLLPGTVCRKPWMSGDLHRDAQGSSLPGRTTMLKQR